jgi:peroxiredoxin
MMLKSIFVSVFMLALVVALGHAAWMLFGQPTDLAWWAVVVAVGAQLYYFVRVFLAPIARTASVMWPQLLLAAAGVVVLLVTRTSEVMPWLYTAGLGLGGGLAFQFWYSRFGRVPSQQIAVGQSLPIMTFETPDGVQVSTGDLQGPLLLIFYRGNWCPLCMAQIGEVAGQYRELEARGVRTVLISSQPPGHTQALATKFNVDFLFLVDQNARVMHELGIVAKDGTPAGLQAAGYNSDTAMPTVVLTNPDKRIIFCDQTDNYRVRPEPATFLGLLDRAVPA